jgi:sterol 3beta-glucosyltransferase
MMMITILCSGSRGDIQPYVALAQQLRKLGKDVRITAGQSFRSFVEGYGIEFYPISADFNTIEVDPKLLKDAQSSDNPLKMLLTFNKMKKYAVMITEEMYNACADSEIVIYHPGCTVGYFAAERQGIPSIMASPFPLHKTREIASVIAYGRFALPNKLTYTLLQTMLWTAGKTGVAALWQEKFGRLPDRFASPYERTDSRHPALISCSNHVFPRPSDWNEFIHQYGYWFVEENGEYPPPKALAEYLNSGEKPIYIGFGSVYHDDDKEHFVKLIIEALSKSGRRGIISGMGEIGHLPDHIFAVDNVPHTWLFPRCAAVCHHGGAGTSAAGFAAGVPSIIIPFSNDQFAWAHRAYDMRVGSNPIPRSKLTADRLAGAIRLATSEAIQSEAAKLGKSIAAENGAADCARVIAACMA